MLSAISFSLYQSKILSSGNGLSLYHTIPTFINLKEKALETLCEKEKMLVNSIFSFSHNVFYPINPDLHKYSF